jgi:hypothetical protein
VDSTVPVIFRHEGYRFFFYSNEGEPREPLHVHVRKGEAVAKIWLEPKPAVSNSYGMSAAELRGLLDIAVENRGLIERFWDEHFGD